MTALRLFPRLRTAALGGGTGLPAVLRALRLVVGKEAPAEAVLQHRFDSPASVSGQTVGNLLLAALTRQLHGDFARAVEVLGQMVGMCGRVLPVTGDDVHLTAEYHGGQTAAPNASSPNVPPRLCTFVNNPD